MSSRNKVATTCTASLEMTLPTAVDDLHDTVSQKYKAWPERIYVIASDGRIVDKTGPGPFLFRPRQAKRALDKLLAGRERK